MRSAEGATPIMDPIIVLGCNRSGTTLLFRNLSSHPGLWSLYIESQDIFYRHYPLDENDGDRVNRAPSPRVASDITEYFYRRSHNKEFFKDMPLLRHIPLKMIQRPCSVFYRRAPLRIVEKTPANCLRVPFLVDLFPDAKFLFLVRRAEDVISSLMEGWKNWSGTGDGPWHFTKWHYLAPPEWREWRDRRLEEICAFQWIESTRTAWEDLTTHCPGRFLLLKHEELLADPGDQYRKIADFCELPPSAYFSEDVVGKIDSRIFTTGGSRPRRDKWQELHGEEIESVRPMFEPLMEQFYG